jgi:murein L,D-transpeptidase YcbB/YkuD
MIDLKARNFAAICALGALVLLGGCHRKRKTRSAPKSDTYADKLKPVVESKQVQVLHWPNFSDYEALVQTFYDDRNYEVAWVDDADTAPKPSPQAIAFIQAFQDAAKKGLNPEDYDASRWAGLTLKLVGKKDDDIVQFDAAMTVSVMRYISDLRIGRVNPTHFNFDINTDDKKYDLPEFVSDNAVDSTDVPKLIRAVEPASEQYRRLEDALAHYLDLANQQAAAPGDPPLPTVAKPLSIGDSYAAPDALQTRLQFEGDMAKSPAPAVAPAPVATANATKNPLQARKHALGTAFGKLEADVRKSTHRASGGTKAAAQAPASAPGSVQVIAKRPPVYSADLSDGVKNYQSRHGFTPDGKLTPQTIASLNIPMSRRVSQIDDSLERWRWLPNDYINAPLMVNLPEFVLRGYTDNGPADAHHLDFTMKVVDGKVMGDHDTPVFAHMMKYVIFRPYWNVPASIIKNELSGHIARSGIGYLASHNFETTDNSGNVVAATAAQVEHFAVAVREKPGPKNSLGLIKFMFPNEYDIYLHSTPQPELFDCTRRDFSHGCVRVQKPADLAVWVMQHGDVDDWDMDKVLDAMNAGPDNHQINLKKEIPVVIFYLTANAGDDGQVHFFDDLYGYDKRLDDVLAKGMPYPSLKQKVNPKASPEGTD